MKLVDYDLFELVACARQAGACESALVDFEPISSMAEALDHERAAFWLSWYAHRILRARWVEAEPVISRDPECAYLYALYVVRGRWEEAETTIGSDPRWACAYARDVTRSRWLDVETVIAKSRQWWQVYREHFVFG